MSQSYLWWSPNEDSTSLPGSPQDGIRQLFPPDTILSGEEPGADPFRQTSYRPSLRSKLSSTY